MEDDDSEVSYELGSAASWLLDPFLDPVIFALVMRPLGPAHRKLLRPPPPLPVPKPLAPWERVALEEWARFGFSQSDADVWMAHGLGRFDAHIAEQSLRYAVTPSMLDHVVDGRRIGERLRSGETAASVAALLRSTSENGRTA